jgi:two-component system, OmpR family, phosphate regulon response regulator PhoB
MGPATAEPLVLVADDDEDLLELACYQLEESGYRVARARDGDEALQMTREQLPDLCVFDVIMPGLRGHEVLAQLRDDEATAAIPVLLVTATLEQRALWRLGPRPDDCMHKQDIGSELEGRVRALLERARETAPAGEAA